jgi:histidinol phosphatase-like enzyme
MAEKSPLFTTVNTALFMKVIKIESTVNVECDNPGIIMKARDEINSNFRRLILVGDKQKDMDEDTSARTGNLLLLGKRLESKYAIQLSCLFEVLNFLI